jgi:hypothetical protein
MVEGRRNRRTGSVATEAGELVAYWGSFEDGGVRRVWRSSVELVFVAERPEMALGLLPFGLASSIEDECDDESE